MSCPCRPYAEFWSAKQQTAEAFAEALCRTGWSLTVAAAQAVARSSVLALAPPAITRFNASAWLTAALLAGLDAADDMTLARAAAAAMTNSSLLKDLGSPAVGSLPAHHQLIQFLTWWVLAVVLAHSAGHVRCAALQVLTSTGAT